MRFLGWDGAIARARQINEVCIRLFGTVTFLSYAIIILCLCLFYYPPLQSRVRVSAVIVFDDQGLFCFWAMSENMTNDQQTAAKAI